MLPELGSLPKLILLTTTRFVVRTVMQNGRVAAFFDLDRTLLAVNSGALWMQRERRVGRISNAQFAEGLVYLVGYHLTLLDMDRVMAKALRTIRGLREEVVRDWTESWYRDEVAQHAAPGAWTALAEHRAAGHRLVLLTSSSPYESAAASAQFGLDDFLCTRYEVQDGCFTGRPVAPICYGAGKVVLAEQYAAAHDLKFADCYFYTDSLSDLPMLERVGHPRVVNPDPRLRRTAQTRGWPIESWHGAATPVRERLSRALRGRFNSLR